jgi:hypothetical protein
MFNTIVEAGAVGAALRYGSGSGSDQKMRLLAAPAPAPQHCTLFYSLGAGTEEGVADARSICNSFFMQNVRNLL